MFDNALALFEIVNSHKLQVQVVEKCPIVQIDSSTGIIVYIPEEVAADTTFVTSKSAELNINVVKDGGEDVVRVSGGQFIHSSDWGKSLILRAVVL